MAHLKRSRPNTTPPTRRIPTSTLRWQLKLSSLFKIEIERCVFCVNPSLSAFILAKRGLSWMSHLPEPFLVGRRVRVRLPSLFLASKGRELISLTRIKFRVQHWYPLRLPLRLPTKDGRLSDLAVNLSRLSTLSNLLPNSKIKQILIWQLHTIRFG